MSGQAREEARNLLRKHNITTVPVDVRKIAESEGIRVVTEPLEQTTFGFLAVKNGRAAIGVNQRNHPYRQRFTIAHELGHYFLHRALSEVFIDVHLTFYRDATSADGIFEQEIQANAFAAEILMPESIVRRYIETRQYNLHDERSLKKLAQQFGVSQDALTFRLINLKILAIDLPRT